MRANPAAFRRFNPGAALWVRHAHARHACLRHACAHATPTYASPACMPAMPPHPFVARIRTR
eukprot:scaffold133413_cov99-Phaeocystis_antarctica.AAC.3